MTPPEPVYYMGWIIQPTTEGFFVYGRQDHSGAYQGEWFQIARDAYRYVDRIVKRGS